MQTSASVIQIVTLLSNMSSCRVYSKLWQNMLMSKLISHLHIHILYIIHTENGVNCDGGINKHCFKTKWKLSRQIILFIHSWKKRENFFICLCLLIATAIYNVFHLCSLSHSRLHCIALFACVHVCVGGWRWRKKSHGARILKSKIIIWYSMGRTNICFVLLRIFLLLLVLLVAMNINYMQP